MKTKMDTTSPTEHAAKLSDLVYAKIAGRIRSGEYPANSKLPTELYLAEALGVSRPVVREALARLRADGVVISRRGSGTYVYAAMPQVDQQRRSPLTSIADLRRCMEFRVSLEGETAYHAALGAEKDRESLISAMRNIEQGLKDPAPEVENDFGFHLAVASATGNRFFRDAMEGLRDSVLAAMGISPSFMAASTQQRRLALVEEHRAVFNAIMANDPHAARTAMRNHLERAMMRVFDGVDA